MLGLELSDDLGLPDLLRWWSGVWWGLEGLFLSSTIEAAGTRARFSRLDLDLLSWVDGSLGGVIPEGLVAIWWSQPFCTSIDEIQSTKDKDEWTSAVQWGVSVRPDSAPVVDLLEDLDLDRLEDEVLDSMTLMERQRQLLFLTQVVPRQIEQGEPCLVEPYEICSLDARSYATAVVVCLDDRPSLQLVSIPYK